MNIRSETMLSLVPSRKILKPVSGFHASTHRSKKVQCLVWWVALSVLGFMFNICVELWHHSPDDRSFCTRHL